MFGYLAFAGCGKAGSRPAAAASAPHPRRLRRSPRPRAPPRRDRECPAERDRARPPQRHAPPGAHARRPHLPTCSSSPAAPSPWAPTAGGEEDERLHHTVTLAPFFLEQTEVSNAAWSECVAAKACRPRATRSRTRHPRTSTAPTTGVRHLVGRRHGLLRLEGQALAARGRVREGRARHGRPPLRLGQRRPDARTDSLLCRADGRRRARQSDWAAAHTATTISPATSGSGSRTSTIPTRTAVRRTRRSTRYLRRDHGRPGRAAAARQAGLHRHEPHSRRVRALHTRGCIQLRHPRSARDQPRAPPRPLPASPCSGCGAPRTSGRS